MHRLALGTVQFGLPYGIANQSGKVSNIVARDMLDLLQRKNIDMLDTAISYGDSESSLGAIGVENFKIVTKLPAVPECCVDIKKWVQTEITTSLARLKVKKIYGLLLHRPKQLLTSDGKQIYKILEDLKESGQVQKIGVSVYDPNELEYLIPQYKLDLVQAPFNLIDRRLHTSGWLQRLKSMDIEIHARSAFLQGLLLMMQEKIPAKFTPWLPLFSKWQNWLEHSKASALQTCLMFVLAFPEIDRVVVGADNLNQLEQIINATIDIKKTDFPDLSCDQEELINPALWSALTT